MKHFVYYEADGSICEITPTKTTSPNLFIEVEHEAVLPFITAAENPAQWYVARGTRELTKRLPRRPCSQHRLLVPFTKPNKDAGLLVTYTDCGFRFEVVGDSEPKLSILSFWVIVAHRGDPYHIITSIEIDYLKMFAGPIDVPMTIADDFALFAVSHEVFANLMMMNLVKEEKARRLDDESYAAQEMRRIHEAKQAADERVQRCGRHS